MHSYKQVDCHINLWEIEIDVNLSVYYYSPYSAICMYVRIVVDVDCLWLVNCY